MLSFLLAALLADFACHCVAGESKAQYRAPLVDIGGPDKNQEVYIVLLKKGYALKDHWETISTDYSSEPRFNNWRHFSTYTARLNATALDYVRRDPNVVCVETDRRLHLHYSSLRDSSDKTIDSYAQDNATVLKDDFVSDVEDDQECEEPKVSPWFLVKTSPRAPWNLAAISARRKLKRFERTLLKHRKDDTFGSYQYMSEAGKGVDVYIIDSGINIDHEWFGGRATNILGRPSFAFSPYTDLPELLYDTENHGTGVAGIVGADYVGVARAANLISVKISGIYDWVNPSVTVSNLGTALHDILKSHLFSCKYFATDDQRFRGSIINFSGAYTELLVGHPTESIQRMFYKPQLFGIVIITAAGNEGEGLNVFRSMPCMVTSVLCVGAIDKRYKIPGFSNWLPRQAAADEYKLGHKFYLAPGVDINTTSSATDISTMMESGTSFACPHVSGIAAIIMGYLGLTRGEDHVKVTGRLGISHAEPRNELSKYLTANALKGLAKFAVKRGRNLDPEDNLLVNTGIHDPDKKPRTPFRGVPPEDVPTERVLHRQQCHDEKYWEGF